MHGRAVVVASAIDLRPYETFPHIFGWCSNFYATFVCSYPFALQLTSSQSAAVCVKCVRVCVSMKNGNWRTFYSQPHHNIKQRNLFQ